MILCACELGMLPSIAVPRAIERHLVGGGGVASIGIAPSPYTRVLDLLIECQPSACRQVLTMVF